MDLYFAHVNAATHQSFPIGPVMHWLNHETSQSQEDLMLIYAMLALGTIYSSRVDREASGSIFADIAVHIIQKYCLKYTLQLYHFARGDYERSWDFLGMGYERSRV